jgi:hypothetical protein
MRNSPNMVRLPSPKQGMVQSSASTRSLSGEGSGHGLNLNEALHLPADEVEIEAL